MLGEPLGRIFGKKEDSYWKSIYKLSLLLAKLDLKVLTEVAGEGGTDCPPQKFLSSQKFRHLMG